MGNRSSRKLPQTKVCSKNVHLWQIAQQQQLQQLSCGMQPMPMQPLPMPMPMSMPCHPFSTPQFDIAMPMMSAGSCFFQAPPQPLAPPCPSFEIANSFAGSASFPPMSSMPPPVQSFNSAALLAPSCPVGECSPMAPVRTVQKFVSMRREQIPVTRQVRSMHPVMRTMRVKVPVQRAVHGTREVCHDVTVNRQRVETFTRMVPVVEKRVVDVPTVEKRVSQVPTVNYVTDYVDQEKHFTEMQEKVDNVTEYITRDVPVVHNCIRTRYETVQTLPSTSYNSGAFGSGAPQNAAQTMSVVVSGMSALGMPGGGQSSMGSFMVNNN